MTIGLTNFLVVFFTLSIYSLLYKENPFSVFAEHTFVGTAQAFALVVAIGFIMDYAITPIQGGNWIPIIPILLGLCTYFRYTTKYRWLARFPIAISIGVGMAVALRALVEVSILKQIQSTLLPLYVANDLQKTFGNILIVVCVLTSILFFYFSRPHTGALGATTRIGYYLIYVGLGGYFGNTFLGRVALVNGRMTDILSPDNIYLTIVMTVVILATVYILDRQKILKKLIGYE